MPIVQFVPFSSSVHPSFWHELTKLKIDVLKLDSTSVPIVGSYTAGKSVVDRETGQDVGLGCHLSLGEDAFQKDNTPSKHSVYVHGTLINFNTVEEFRASDKAALFNTVANDLWSSITSKTAPTTPLSQNINRFLLLTFADLKKYKYYYWFTFPAFVASPAWCIDGSGWQPAQEVLPDGSLESIHRSLEEKEAKGRDIAWFLARPSATGGAYDIADLNEWDAFFTGVSETARIVGFLDPSSTPNPGWPLRNLLSYISTFQPATTSSTPLRLNILSWRDVEVPTTNRRWASRWGTIELPASVAKQEVSTTDGVETVQRPAAVGWEKNAAGKLAPRLADLAPMMDPTRLADQAVDLNLKLMRWRILPSLDLDKVASTRCLLLGAGTLGCYVARTLMGWGVRNITLVDSGKVSFSNPVRQPLFEFEDCLDGGKPKAACAADRLKKIFPGVNAVGYDLAVPMPGHPVPPSEVTTVKETVRLLEELYDSHDAIFLLMDSRESRWLPTVLGTAKDKYVLNAALGFDTFLVMRHGARPRSASTTTSEGVPPTRLGCYYCNDIVAPSDSLTDRTLDQMCTVTRPGLAPIAASTAVELLVSMIQHPDGIHAAPSGGKDDEEGYGVLGAVPHQLRGFLSRFQTMTITGARYDRCTGCSDTVVREYEEQGFDMILKACNDSGYLEQLTGLDKLYEESEAIMESVDWDEEDDED